MTVVSRSDEAGVTAAPGIAVRPEVDPVVLAVLAAAADQAWPRRHLVAPAEPEQTAGLAVQRSVVVETALGPPPTPMGLRARGVQATRLSRYPSASRSMSSIIGPSSKSLGV